MESSFGIFIFFYAIPYFPVHIYTLMIDSQQNVDRTSLTCFLCGVYEFVVMFIVSGKVIFTLLIYAGIHTCMSTCLRCITFNPKDPRIQSWEYSYHKYMSIQLFYQKYNDLYANFLLIFMLNFMFVFWTNFYSHAMIYKQASFFLAFFLTICYTTSIIIFIISKIPGDVFTLSQAFINSWELVLVTEMKYFRDRRIVQYRRKILKSCRPISAMYGSFIRMKPSTSLFLLFLATSNLIVFFTI